MEDGDFYFIARTDDENDLFFGTSNGISDDRPGLDDFDPNRGRRVSEAMLKRDLQYNCQLCYDLGVSESSLSRWRSGHPLTTLNAINLCLYLNISIEWLLFGRTNTSCATNTSASNCFVAKNLPRLDQAGLHETKALIQRLLTSTGQLSKIA